MASRGVRIKRAATLLQTLYLQFREMTYPFQLVGVEHKDGLLVIKNGHREKGTFQKFGPDVSLTGEERAMVLSFNGCSLAVGYFQGLLERLLDGTDVTISGITLYLTPTGEVAQYADDDRRAHSHTLFRISSHNNEKKQWFVDLSGPQYSIFTPCLRGDLYRMTYRVQQETKLTDSYLRDSYRATSQQDDDEGLDHRMKRRVVETIEKAIKEWEGRDGALMTEALELPDDAVYERMSEGLLGFVEDKMTELRSRVDWTKRFKARLR